MAGRRGEGTKKASIQAAFLPLKYGRGPIALTVRRTSRQGNTSLGIHIKPGHRLQPPAVGFQFLPLQASLKLALAPLDHPPYQGLHQRERSNCSQTRLVQHTARIYLESATRMRDSGFHPFKGRVSRHFGDTVRTAAYRVDGLQSKRTSS